MAMTQRLVIGGLVLGIVLVAGFTLQIKDGGSAAVVSVEATAQEAVCVTAASCMPQDCPRPCSIQDCEPQNCPPQDCRPQDCPPERCRDTRLTVCATTPSSDQ